MPTAPFGFLRVAAACPPVAVGDPDRCVDAILPFVRRAAGQGVQVLALPELALGGYTCGDLFFSLTTLVGGAERALQRLLRETEGLPMVLAVGLPVAHESRLFNAGAVLQGGRLLGVVPKTYLPGYKEYYEERWFSSSREVVAGQVRLAGATVPFGADLIFSLEQEPGVCLGVEICEDLWAPFPPSCHHAVAGATVILNLSASNELVGKADYRRDLVKVQSGRALCAYVYADAGVHESTTDVAFGGHLLVAENAAILAESRRFVREGELLATEVDVERLLVERVRQGTFAEGVHALQNVHRVVPLQPMPVPDGRRLVRPVEPLPFVPSDPRTRDERCREVFAIQTAGLARRLEATGLTRVNVGLSGGLDSTLALLVAVGTFELLGLPRSDVRAVTMPGFGTSRGTLENARALARGLGVSLREIDIRPACTRHIADIGLDPADTESVTFQNLQSRERMQVLLDLANLERSLNVGTGDLSEIALGWSTFGGDHISTYNVNAGVPKTLVRELVAWSAERRAGAEREVLLSVLATPVSPELVLSREGEIGHRTEDILGPYEAHDFFLFALVRLGAGPRKILYLAEQAFASRHSPEQLRGWLRTFLTRFFDQQFKRSVFADGPKVGSVGLSPRGDWRMPSDASKAAWLAELG